MIEDEVLNQRPVVNLISLLAQTLRALDAATEKDTQIPMLVDCEFEIR